MSSEGEPGDKLRAGLFKNATGHDRIQARDLYKSESEFRFKANTVLCFNENPSVDDNSGGIARRFALVNFSFKFVDEPFLTAKRSSITACAQNYRKRIRSVPIEALYRLLRGERLRLSDPSMRQAR